MRIRLGVFGLGLAVAAAGCSGNGSTSGGDAGTTAQPDMAMPATCMPDGQKATLASRYGIKLSLNVNVKVPSNCEGDACILDKDTQSLMLLLADVTQNGQMLTLQAHACHFQVPPVAVKNQPPTVLTASDELVQAVMAAPSTAMLDGTDTCAKFSTTPLALVIGAHLANPTSDPVPVYSNGSVKLCDGKASSDCAMTMDTGCICDLDKDGKPGATVGATGVPALDDVDQLYLAIRTVVGMDAQVWPPVAGQATPGPRFKGTVAGLMLDQSPVGCHHTPMGGGAPYDCTTMEVNSVAALNPKLSQSTNTPSTFVAVPVGDTETCSQLVADAPMLFKNQ